MPDPAIVVSIFRGEDKQNELRKQIHSNQFQDADEICHFLHLYVAAYPDETRGKSSSFVYGVEEVFIDGAGMQNQIID